jgi:hypothetical protein
MALRPFPGWMVLPEDEYQCRHEEKYRYAVKERELRRWASTVYSGMTYGTIAKAALQAECFDTPSDLKLEYSETMTAKVAPPLSVTDSQ